LLYDWGWFDSLYCELKKLKPSQKLLNTFGKNQMEITIGRNAFVITIKELRRKLLFMDIPESIIDVGFENGYKILKSLKYN
jgi:hypothetical protein